ncbi:MAG: tetrapyrrole methylase family protein/MazG family protein [Candidatus Poriferisodalaceae bacterium]
MTARVIVGGLGPAGPELITAQVTELASTHPTFLRTARHPAAAAFDLPSFDDLYETSATFEDVYSGIVDRLVASGEEHGTVGYLVPGSPLVAEHTVELLRADPRVDAVILPAVSFLDVSWVALGIDPVEAGVRLIDGHRFGVEAAGERGPLLISQVHDQNVLSDIKLLLDPGDHRGGASAEGPKVVVLQRLGLPDESVFEVDWFELDREVKADHLTSLYIARLKSPVANELIRFHELVRTLRQDCPWDQEQTHQTLVRHLVEETYEVIEAIDALDPESGEGFAELEDELGDLLFQVVFHAVLGAEAGWFDLADIARGIHDKLVRRHPHVFGQNDLPGTDTGSSWELIKAAERGDGPDRSALEGIPPLPPLAKAAKLVRKASAAGFEWGTWRRAHDKLVEEVAEVEAAAASGDHDHTIHELGDVIMAVVALAQNLDVDPDEATRRAIDRFSSRFRSVEAQARAEGRSLTDATTDEQLEWWARAKLAEDT